MAGRAGERRSDRSQGIAVATHFDQAGIYGMSTDGVECVLSDTTRRTKLHIERELTGTQKMC